MQKNKCSHHNMQFYIQDWISGRKEDIKNEFIADTNRNVVSQLGFMCS